MKMQFTRPLLSLFFIFIISTALAAKSEETLVCHVGSELGSSGETYQENPDCTVPPEWGGDPGAYTCPDAGKVDLILVSKNARHVGNPAHHFVDPAGVEWNDFEPEDGIGDDPADFEEFELIGIDRGCEVEGFCPCVSDDPRVAAYDWVECPGLMELIPPQPGREGRMSVWQEDEEFEGWELRTLTTAGEGWCHRSEVEHTETGFLQHTITDRHGHRDADFNACGALIAGCAY